MVNLFVRFARARERVRRSPRHCMRCRNVRQTACNPSRAKPIRRNPNCQRTRALSERLAQRRFDTGVLLALPAPVLTRHRCAIERAGVQIAASARVRFGRFAWLFLRRVRPPAAPPWVPSRT